LSQGEYLSPQKVTDVIEEAQRALLLEKGGVAVRMTTVLKNQLKEFINAHEKKLQDYDKKLLELRCDHVTIT
jgi:NADH:ubiquinone oxidoreductase subunit D